MHECARGDLTILSLVHKALVRGNARGGPRHIHQTRGRFHLHSPSRKTKKIAGCVVELEVEHGDFNPQMGSNIK